MALIVPGWGNIFRWTVRTAIKENIWKPLSKDDPDPTPIAMYRIIENMYKKFRWRADITGFWDRVRITEALSKSLAGRDLDETDEKILITVIPQLHYDSQKVQFIKIPDIITSAPGSVYEKLPTEKDKKHVQSYIVRSMEKTGHDMKTVKDAWKSYLKKNFLNYNEEKIINSGIDAMNPKIYTGGTPTERAVSVFPEDMTKLTQNNLREAVNQLDKNDRLLTGVQRKMLQAAWPQIFGSPNNFFDYRYGKPEKFDFLKAMPFANWKQMIIDLLLNRIVPRGEKNIDTILRNIQTVIEPEWRTVKTLEANQFYQFLKELMGEYR